MKDKVFTVVAVVFVAIAIIFLSLLAYDIMGAYGIGADGS